MIDVKSIRPSKIICLGWNYRDHITELGHSIPDEPMIFFKPPSALVGPDEPVVLPNPKLSKEVNNEVELAVLIGKKAKNVTHSDAYDHVLGYTIMQDITARDIQNRLRARNQQWEISKSFDTFAPIGPHIVPHAKIGDPHNLNISLKVNGRIRQDSNTRSMIFKIPYIIEYLSKVMTLESGDVIATGTPRGVDLIRDGDLLEAEIEKIGVFRNTVVTKKC